MKALSILYLCGIGLFLTMRAVASEAPVVQIQVEPEAVVVGEAVTLRVSVYAPTWFPQPPEFPSFELPNTITRLPPNSSGPVSARVNGSTWSGISRRYEVIPLIAGRFVIAGRTIGVTYADPDSRAPITLELGVPEVVIDAEVPDGAQDLNPYLAGTSFQLERMVDGDLDNLAAGDALVIRYRASIEGLPAVFLPPLWQPDQAVGLSGYADEPQLSEEGGRSVREERVTVIFETGGAATLPGIELPWWNTRTAAIESAQLDSLQLRIAGSGGVRQTLSSGGMGVWWIAGLLAGVLGVGLLFWLLRPRWQRFVEQRQIRRDQYLVSEAYAFAELQQLLQQGDGKAAYRQLLRWLWRLEPGLRADQLAIAVNDAELARQLQLLRDAAMSPATETLDFAGLNAALADARRQFTSRQPDAATAVLPALNPQ